VSRRTGRIGLRDAPRQPRPWRAGRRCRRRRGSLRAATGSASARTPAGAARRARRRGRGRDRPGRSRRPRDCSRPRWPHGPAPGEGREGTPPIGRRRPSERTSSGARRAGESPAGRPARGGPATRCERSIPHGVIRGADGAERRLRPARPLRRVGKREEKLAPPGRVEVPMPRSGGTVPAASACLRAATVRSAAAASTGAGCRVGEGSVRAGLRANPKPGRLARAGSRRTAPRHSSAASPQGRARRAETSIRPKGAERQSLRALCYALGVRLP